MTFAPPSTVDLLTPLNLAQWSSEGKYHTAKHLRLIEHEVLEVIQPDSDWDVLIVQCPPRHGKSLYLSQRFPAWYHNVYPDRSSIITSYSVELARRNSRFVRDEVHRTSAFYGNGGINRNVAAAGEWEMVAGGACKAAGVGGGITGRGCSILVIDDFLKNAEQALSERIRESQWEWFQTTAFTRLEPGGKLIILATRWHSEDLIGRILKFALEEKMLRVREISMPALAEPTDSHPDPLGRLTDEALWPERWPAEALKRIRDTLEDYWWSALYQQRLGTHGKNEWPESYFWGILVDDDKWPDYFHLSATALDPSKGKDSKRGDYSAIVHSGFGHGNIWVDADIQRRPVPDMLEDLVAFNHAHAPLATGIESNAFQELLGAQYFQMASMRGLAVEDPVLMNNTVSKRVRIARLGLWLRLHKIKIRNNAHGRLLVKQLKEFPNGDHDDGCFAAGTMVETPAGSKRIEMVRAGEQVLTRFGWRKVHAAECTGVRYVTEYTVSDGSSLVATPDHPVYDGHSFSQIQSRSELYKCEFTKQQSQRQSSTEASRLGDTQRQNSGHIECTTRRMQGIDAMALGRCIRRFGRTPTERYQRASRSTMQTAIRLTMQSRILSALQRQNTTRSTQQRDPQGQSSQMQQGQLQQSGTDQKQVGHGTESMQANVRKQGSRKPTAASSVAKLSAALHSMLDSALPSAGSDSMPLSALPVCERRSREAQKVYNLVVEGGEYLANGFVVHNCDAMEMAIRLLLELSDELASVSSTNVI